MESNECNNWSVFHTELYNKDHDLVFCCLQRDYYVLEKIAFKLHKIYGDCTRKREGGKKKERKSESQKLTRDILFKKGKEMLRKARNFFLHYL